jgi:hypothetical protein
MRRNKHEKHRMGGVGTVCEGSSPGRSARGRYAATLATLGRLQ